MLKISPSLEHNFRGFCSSSSVIMLFVYMKGRFSLSYRELEEIMQIRGAMIDHSTLQRWVRKFAFLIDQRVRRRKKPVNGSWRMDETYIKLNGDTIDFFLRARRDGQAAKSFFRKAFKTHGRPEKVAVDKSGSNKFALDHFNKDLEKEDQYEIRQVKYLNNIVEQDHRFIKKRTKPTLGFKNLHSAKATLTAIENVRMIQKGQIIGQTANKSSFHNFAALMA